MEDEHGMARCFHQHGDADEMVEEAKAACPVSCIKDVDYDTLVRLEVARRSQTINNAGRLSARAEGKAPRTPIFSGLVDTSDPAFIDRQVAFHRERARAAKRRFVPGAKGRVVEL